MNTTLKTLLTVLLGVAALGVGTHALADAYGNRHDWRDDGRHAYRWDDRRHHDIRHHGWHAYRPYPGYRNVYFVAPPPWAYHARPVPVPVSRPVYRAPGPAVIIDLPPIIIR